MIQQFIHTIAKEEIAKLTVEEFKGRIITILSKEEADKAVEYLLRFPIVGFDTETRPSFKNYVGQFGIEDASLQKIYAILFQKKISKGQRLTNWEADVLTDSQKKYAALDAWACLRIYNLLNQA